MMVGVGCRLSYLANLMVNNSLMPTQSVLVFRGQRKVNNGVAQLAATGSSLDRHKMAAIARTTHPGRT